MGRSKHDFSKRLTSEPSDDLTAQLEELRARVALLNEKGRSGTAHHELLARLEALAAGTALPSQDNTFAPSETADDTQLEEDSDNG